MKKYQKYLAEVFGTFVFVFVGTAVAYTTGEILLVAMAFPLVVLMMIFTIGEISGAQLNPAVSLGLLLDKRITGKEFVLYVLSQLVGGLLGSGLLALLVGSTSNLATNQVQSLDNNLLAILVEAVITAIFVFVVLKVTSKENTNKFAGFVIPLALFAMILVGFNFSSGSLNPARSLAPALLEGGTGLNQVWIFIVGPFIGSGLGALLFKSFK